MILSDPPLWLACCLASYTDIEPGVGQQFVQFVLFNIALARCYTVGQYYSSPPLIRPPYLQRNYGHIIEVAFGEREN